VEQFEQWQPHLIWMDIRMPVMDGLEATRKIKAMPSGIETKVVALTAHALEEERREILDSGCDDFIRKPYRDFEIYEALVRHLGVRFIYVDDEVIESSVSPMQQLELSRLKQVPADLLKELSNSALLLDESRCLNVIDKISDTDDELAKQLAQMVDDLKYRELLAATDSLASSESES
jgi:CheY-like chemotaxis protein